MVSRGLRSVVLSNTQTIAGRADNLVWKYTVILSSGIDHDLSILTLCCPLQMSRSVSPVCLPPLPPSSYTGVLATVSGWGTLSSGGSHPDRLMGVNVTVIKNKKCDQKYDEYDITESAMCARDDGKGICQGDSGGNITLYDLYYSTLYRSPDNHGGWWLLLTDRCGQGGHRLCTPFLSRDIYQGYSVFALDWREY